MIKIIEGEGRVPFTVVLTFVFVFVFCKILDKLYTVEQIIPG